MTGRVGPECGAGAENGDCRLHILNVCVNVIRAGSVDPDPAKWQVAQEMLKHEIAKVKKAKAEHSGEKGKKPRSIGFCS